MLTPVCALAQRVDLAPVDRVWSGHSVPFALAVTPRAVIVAYYDAERRLSLASRLRRGGAWAYSKLDSVTGWDSHNGIAIAVDVRGRIHVAANMHNDPLIYFRSAAPGDIGTMRRVPVMAEAARERRVTYPVFLKDGAGRLVFKYRDGGSGNGNEIYNVLDAQTGRWRPLLAAPLTDGEGQRNAYFVGPVLGPDRWFHLTWVWRETPDAATNHDLSYARSRDLVHWQRSDGTPLALPIMLASAEIVDPVPAGRGMINNNTVVGFDPAGAPVIAFHKFDAGGNTQVYVARRGRAGWRIAQASDWRGFRWDFGGGGTLVFRLSVGAPVPLGRDRIRVPVVRDGKPVDLLLDGRTLARLGEVEGSTLAQRLAPLVAVPPGMQLDTAEDPGGSGLALAWAARPPNRDLPGADIPAPTTLFLVRVSGSAKSSGRSRRSPGIWRGRRP
ncbi:MAG: BNR repeat-containing protein [Pseudomonadota bacterium]